MELQYASKFLPAQQLLIEKIVFGAKLSECLDLLCQLIERALNSPPARSSILLLEGNHLVHGGAPSLPAEISYAIDGIKIGPKVGPCGTAVYTRKQVIVKDIATNPLCINFKDLLLQHGLKSCWSTPIISSNNEVLGSFAIYYSEVKEPEKAHLKLIEYFTQLSALAIEKEQSSLRDKQLYETQQKLALHIENTPMAVIQLDIHNRVVEWNGAAQKIFGFSKQEMLGQPAMDSLFQNLKSNDVGKLLSSKAKTPQSICHHVHKNGGHIICEWFITPLIGDDQELGYAALVVDITQARPSWAGRYDTQCLSQCDVRNEWARHSNYQDIV